MKYSLSIQLLNYLIMFLPLVGALGLLVTGIMVTAGKEKTVKFLGICFILESVGSFINGSRYLILRSGMNAKAFANYSVGSSYISAICGLAALVCICIFIHKNYGKKPIYIPVLSVHVGGWLVSRVVMLLLSKAISGQAYAAWLSLTSLINAFVISAAVNIIIIVMFFKNRKAEKVIPQAWLCESINLGCSFFGLLFNCLYYLCVIMKMNMYRDFDLYIYLIASAFSLASLILPVYTTVMVYKKQKEPEQV